MLACKQNVLHDGSVAALPDASEALKRSRPLQRLRANGRQHAAAALQAVGAAILVSNFRLRQPSVIESDRTAAAVRCPA
jgi:hypothetical protein